MCDKVVNRCFLVFDCISNQYKTQEMCDRVVSEYAFLIVYWLDKDKTRRIHDEPVDDCLAALEFIPAWFVKSKMLGKSYKTLFANDDILFFNEDFDKVTFIAKFKTCSC